MTIPATLDDRPSFRNRRAAIALIGCGAAAKELHLPAYQVWGVDVAVSLERTLAACRSADLDGAAVRL